MTAARKTAPPRARLQSSTPAGDAVTALLAPAQAAEPVDPSSAEARKPASVRSSDTASERARKPASAPASTTASTRASKRASTPASVPASTPTVDLTAPRVRTQRRYVEQFNTRLTTDMHLAVEKHVAKTGEARVDLVDRALRLALGMSAEE